MWAAHQIAVRNVQSIQIVQRIWLAFVTNAKIHALALAVPMPSALSSIIDHIALV